MRWDAVIRWGGWALFVAAVLLVVFVAGVIVTGQELPVPAEEALDSPGTPTTLFVSVFAPFLIIAGVPEAIGFIGLALGAVWQFVVGLKLARFHERLVR